MHGDPAVFFGIGYGDPRIPPAAIPEYFFYTAGFSLPNGRGCDKMKENHRQLFGRFEHWIFYGKTDVLQKDAATVEKADCQNVKFGAGVKMIKNVRRSEV